MIALIILWALALIVLVLLAYYGHTQKDVLRTPPQSFGAFLSEEFQRIENILRRELARFHPHGKRALVSGGTLIKKGHDAFLEKLFGGMAVEKGKVSSFFLKHIAEHKESLRDTKGRGKGL